VNPFAGVTILSLAVIGVICRWRHPWTRLLVLVSCFGFLVALGTNTPLHGLLYALVPMVEKARSPGVSIFIFNFGLAMLAACGIAYLVEAPGSPVVRKTGIALLVSSAVIAAVALAAYLVQKDLTGQNIWISVLASLAVGSMLLAFNRQAIGGGTLIAGLATVMLTELTVGGLIAGIPSRYEPNRNHLIDRLAGSSSLVAFLRGQPRPFRVTVNDTDVPFNFGDWHGIETSGGYLASLTMNVADAQTHSPQVQRLIGARYYLAKAPQREDQRLVFEDPSGLKLFENPDVMPRAWAVHRVEQVKSRPEAIDYVVGKREPLHASAPVLEAGIAVAQCPGSDQVRVLENRPGWTVVEAELGCKGMVVLSDLYFPGWKATVDGRDARIHEVYGFLRGVIVDGGKHRVEMVYRPRSVYLGAAMTATGAALALAAALAGFGFLRRKSAILTY
jgi:hypothetical protein